MCCYEFGLLLPLSCGEYAGMSLAKPVSLGATSLLFILLGIIAVIKYSDQIDLKMIHLFWPTVPEG